MSLVSLWVLWKTDDEFRKAVRSWTRWCICLMAGESTILYGIGVNKLADFNLGVIFQMIITFGTITLPWVSDKAKTNGNDKEA